MFKLKEFYQYKKALVKYNKVFKSRTSMKLFSPISKAKTFAPTLQSPLAPASQGLIYLKASMSNTIITLTDLKGKVISMRSCGALGFKGKKKRSTKVAIESTIDSLLSKIRELGWKKVFLFLSGFAKGRFLIISCLKNAGLKTSLVRDITPFPHNGCRPKKLRRG